MEMSQSMKVWAGPCESCGKLSAVRKSITGASGIEFPHPNRKSLVQCPHCGHKNEFSDLDLVEVDANILEKEGESTTDHPDTPSDKQ
jgi:hypothetical protein